MNPVSKIFLMNEKWIEGRDLSWYLLLGRDHSNTPLEYNHCIPAVETKIKSRTRKKNVVKTPNCHKLVQSF